MNGTKAKNPQPSMYVSQNGDYTDVDASCACSNNWVHLAEIGCHIKISVLKSFISTDKIKLKSIAK